MSGNAGSVAEPWMTPGIHTDPDCDGSCGGNRIHPSALAAADDGEEAE